MPNRLYRDVEQVFQANYRVKRELQRKLIEQSLRLLSLRKVLLPGIFIFLR